MQPPSKRPVHSLRAGDVLPAGQLVVDHGHESGWTAVRLARPNARPFTGARLPRRHTYWRAFVVVSREVDGVCREWSIPADTLVLIRGDADPTSAESRAILLRREGQRMPKATRDPLIARSALAIRRLREARGFSQEGFAKHIGMHRTFMGIIERGNTNPSLLTLARVAEGLGLTLTELMREVERIRLVTPGRKVMRRGSLARRAR